MGENNLFATYFCRRRKFSPGLKVSVGGKVLGKFLSEEILERGIILTTEK